MGARDPNKTQLDFPQLVADIIEQLNLTGQLGILELSDVVAPVYIVGQRQALSTSGGDATTVPFQSSEVFSARVNSPAAGAVIVDTGQLQAGDYNISFGAGMAVLLNSTTLEFQHRNAANTATLATWFWEIGTGMTAQLFPLSFTYQIALNERLRVVNTLLAGAGAIQTAYIMAHLIPPP